MSDQKIDPVTPRWYDELQDMVRDHSTLPHYRQAAQRVLKVVPELQRVATAADSFCLNPKDADRLKALVVAVGALRRT